MRNLCLLAGLLGAAACRGRPDPTPTEIDGLLHYFFTEYERGEDQDLIDAVDNMEAWFDIHAIEGEVEGTITNLTGAEVEIVGINPNVDMTWMNSALHFYEQSCTVAQLEELYLFPDQGLLFPGNYISYERTYRDEYACFDDGSCDYTVWDTAIESSFSGLLRAVYDLESGLRRVSGEDSDGQPMSALLSRTHMPEPAVVGQGNSGAFFDQTYQIEVFLDTSEGRSLHLYGLWSAGGLVGLDPNARVWSNEYLAGLKDWNYRLDELCAMPDPFNPIE